ncbi:hypothetical protein GS534_24250 [Rhodococcus hoagii]|nr:hypothetical protein [Prescottella equi]NKS33142.1 hypothetical protein [Prescottella equi]
MERLAMLLRTDGTTERIDLGKTDRQALDSLYSAIGCTTVDMIKLAPNLHLWVDDEALVGSDLLTPAGLIEGEEKVGPVPNRYAGAIVTAVVQSILGQELYGNVVFTAGADEEGNTMGLRSDFADTLNGWVEKIRPLIEDDREGDE